MTRSRLVFTGYAPCDLNGLEKFPSKRKTHVLLARQLLEFQFDISIFLYTFTTQNYQSYNRSYYLIAPSSQIYIWWSLAHSGPRLHLHFGGSSHWNTGYAGSLYLLFWPNLGQTPYSPILEFDDEKVTLHCIGMNNFTNSHEHAYNLTKSLKVKHCGTKILRSGHVTIGVL